MNPAGFTIHRCIHAVRDDAGGVLPISQPSTFVRASLGYRDDEGVALREEQQPGLQADLGSNNHLMPRNHGLLTVGKTIAGGERVTVNPKILHGMATVMKTATAGQGANIAWPALSRKAERADPSYRT